MIESGASNLQYATQRADRVLMAMLVHITVFHSDSLANYHVAFLNMSRSSSKRRIWARNRKISILASRSSIACYTVLSGVTALTHL